MTNPAHIMETALLVLAAYLLGCCLGYGAHRILHAARGARKAPIAAPVAPPLRVRTPAARLAATGRDDPPTPLPSVSAPKAKSVEKPPAKARPKPADPKPMALPKPRNGKADNLKLIKGIGPKIEASLNALGIFHVDQIANWTKVNIDWVDGQLAFKGRIRRERWVEQAVDLAKDKAE